MLRYYTVDHTFELILTDIWARDQDDSEREAVLETLYNKADEIFKDLHNSKVNGTANVLSVFDPTLLEPEFFDDKKIIVLRMQVTIKYRGATTT